MLFFHICFSYHWIYSEGTRLGAREGWDFHTHPGELIKHFITDTWRFLDAKPQTGGNKHVDCAGFCFSFFAGLAKGCRSSVSSGVLHCGRNPVQAVLPSSGVRSCQCLWLSDWERKLRVRSSGQQAVGRTLQPQERGWQREVAHQVLQSDLQMYRWVMTLL